MGLELLSAPFHPSKISWRVGSTKADKTKGMALAYIDARDVMERLDEAVGPENWQRRYTHADKKTICEIGIKVDSGEWVWKSDGAGDSDIEAEKGAISDAFKRAAVNWGIGRYLYDIESPWVELELATNKDGELLKDKNGNPIVRGIAKHELERLRKMLEGKLPDDRPAKALHFAKSVVEIYRKIVEIEDKEGYIAANKASIDAAMKYPEAKKVLEEEGIVT